FLWFFFFFFQAEDGIRDLIVTGVQTCALPIYVTLDEFYHRRPVFIRPRRIDVDVVELVAGDHFRGVAQTGEALVDREVGERNSRSEERRVGKECRSRRAA